MNIYVSKFSEQTNDDQLRELFTSYGEVTSAKIEIDSFTDKSRCFGYVEMPNEEEAKAAIHNLHESSFNGNSITVQESLPKEERRGSYKVGNSINPYRFKKN